MTLNYTSLGFAALLLVAASCKKEDNPTPTVNHDELTAKILTDFSDKVAFATYSDLVAQTALLNSEVDAFVANADDARLKTIRQYWVSARSSWELSESFLFGPVSTESMDPAVDDWPVSNLELDSVLNSSATIDAAYVEQLPTTLKGFHAIEYLIYGPTSQKTAAQFTAREKTYLKELSQNMLSVTQSMKASWDRSNSSSFGQEFVKAGQSGSQFATQRAAFEEMVNAMAGIVEEVGAEKMNTPFISKDSTLEESHFSKNSFKDFANNMKGVKNAYMGTFKENGTGMNQYVASINKTLDLKIQQQIDAAISVFSNFQNPFGTAITKEPAAIQNAQKVLEELHETLEHELLTLVQDNMTK